MRPRILPPEATPRASGPLLAYMLARRVPVRRNYRAEYEVRARRLDIEIGIALGVGRDRVREARQHDTATYLAWRDTFLCLTGRGHLVPEALHGGTK